MDEKSTEICEVTKKKNRKVKGRKKESKEKEMTVLLLILTSKNGIYTYSCIQGNAISVA